MKSFAREWLLICTKLLLKSMPSWGCWTSAALAMEGLELLESVFGLVHKLQGCLRHLGGLHVLLVLLLPLFSRLSNSLVNVLDLLLGGSYFFCELSKSVSVFLDG